MKEPQYEQNGKTGGVTRIRPKRDKTMSARQWRKRRRLLRQAGLNQIVLDEFLPTARTQDELLRTMLPQAEARKR